jgi:phospholipase C
VSQRKKRAKKRIVKASAGKQRRTKKAQAAGRGGKTPRRAARVRMKFVAVPADAAVDNLQKINNIVVLMMENRSFDHMLGYLRLEENRSDVDGLTPGMSNSDGKNNYPIHHLEHTALRSSQDPCHSGQCVAEQVANSNGGFVKNYIRTHPGDSERDLVMGYYNKKELLTYDYLAAEFAICDQWFSSVPGATWPNRLYAAAGRANGSKDNKTIPIYNLPAFVRYLDARKVIWGWYTDNFFGSTLNLIDRKYRSLSNYNLDDFYRQAAEGNLPSVCWIDPIFVTTAGAFAANDDHPPADIRRGQEFVLNIYHALASNPEQWRKTVLVIVYDEHGGFYDHVTPPAAEDDNPSFRSYGVRVPAVLVSPWVAQGAVVSTLFDHTSIIKTILLRFCRKADGSIPDMGKRVASANHLGYALTEAAARPSVPKERYEGIVAAFAGWESERFAARFQRDHVRMNEVHELNDFQKGLLNAAKRLPPKRQKISRAWPARVKS